MRNIGQYNLFNKISDSDYHFLEVTNDLNKHEESYVVDIVFNYFRKTGFPHYKIEDGEKTRQLDKLMSFDHFSLLDKDKVNQSMQGLRLAWSYFPHFWGVRCGNAKYTPLDIFDNDDLFKNTIKQTYKFCMKYENGKMSISRLRQSLKVYNGTQVVSNFRPTAAKLIYELFNTNGVVWDMSCGWGGRLLGALSNFKIKTYIGTEPSTKTFDGLLKMKQDFSNIKNVELFKLGSEDYLPDKNSLGLCFTSPPYFDTEKYSNESTQSYIKYPSEDEWINGFMLDTLKNCYYGLKNDGFLVLNIANTSSAKKIEKGLMLIAKKTGFEYIKQMRLILSSISGAGVKYEPIYIFKKKIKCQTL